MVAAEILLSAHITSVTLKYIQDQKIFGAKVVEIDKILVLRLEILFISVRLKIIDNRKQKNDIMIYIIA
jgi:hypothetical protein